MFCSYYFINSFSELALYFEPSSLYTKPKCLQTQFFPREMLPVTVILHQCKIFFSLQPLRLLSGVFLDLGELSQAGVLGGLMCLDWSGPKLLWLKVSSSLKSAGEYSTDPLLCSPGGDKRQVFPVFTGFSSLNKSVNNTSVILPRSSLLGPYKASGTAHLPALSKKCFQVSSGVSAGAAGCLPQEIPIYFSLFFFLGATFFLSSMQVGHHWIGRPSAFNAHEVCAACMWLSVQTSLHNSYSTSGIYGMAIKQKQKYTTQTPHTKQLNSNNEKNKKILFSLPLFLGRLG